jgi:DNA-binding Lrp family transcriptional regulator
MTLTHRQTMIVRVLLDLYREAREPISYRVVAERLGVSAPTAYRLLRLAEAEGYVAAVYAPRPAVGGVGRAAVMFVPTEPAHRLIASVAGPEGDADWEATKRRVLEALDGGRLPDAERIGELVAELDTPGSSLATAGRLIAALMLMLEESRAPADRRELPVRLAEGGGRMGLAALGGLLVGLAWADRRRRVLSARLERRLQHLTDALAALSPAEAADLTDFVEQLGRRLRECSATPPASNARRGPAGGPDGAPAARPLGPR